MELRLDRLLADLRDNPETILGAIDADPLLVKRTSGDLILANATQALYTPQAQHQLYAKGIVYRRNPYRLVSLPLVKIYNVGERDVTVADLLGIANEPEVRLRFLRKMDGSLIQLFRAEGRTWVTTRGMIEGARWRADDDDDEQDEDRSLDFDYVAVAREMVQSLYPRVLSDESALDGRTMLFELIHPQARKVTNYGERADLVFIGCFDQRRVAYLAHDDLRSLAECYHLNLVDALSPTGSGLGEQIESLLASLAGTDEEGSVVCFERGDEIIYRVKVKSPEYLQLMKLMAFCTYERTVELIDANPGVDSWDDLKAVLQEQGRDQVPEEVLTFYRQHWDNFQSYLVDLMRLGKWGESTCQKIDTAIGGRTGRDPGAYRKAFAAQAVTTACPALVFAALDGRVDVPRLRKMARTPDEVAEMLTKVGLAP
jgi:hypothetical protein